MAGNFRLDLEALAHIQYKLTSMQPSNEKEREETKMKLRNLKKAIVAMTMASMLSVCMLPNMVHAQTISVGNKTISVSLFGSTSEVTAVTSYTQGPGSVGVSVTGYAYKNSNPNLTKTLNDSRSPITTPGGVAASVSAPSGYRFYKASSKHSYSVGGASGTYDDSIEL